MLQVRSGTDKPPCDEDKEPNKEDDEMHCWQCCSLSCGVGIYNTLTLLTAFGDKMETHPQKLVHKTHLHSLINTGSNYTNDKYNGPGEIQVTLNEV
ncbi:hypothetical protein Y032_0946g3159 [Ancylostoma ceylanicum]|uniref:Uncharacterized protein n=1 Tax=Ancylostoma ceylanicum TaxID=53326 RepID=A0A016W8T2_9BILA|nr:hypothetical protein Y032_0946g3159 [Ancylostoma ceylanicum]